MGSYHVMFLYMFHVNCFCDSWYLINIPYIRPYVRIVKYPLLVTLVCEKKTHSMNKSKTSFVKTSITLNYYYARSCI